MNQYSGGLNGSGQKHALIVCRWNDFITNPMKNGALQSFKDHAVEADDVDTFSIPGAFEIGATARTVALTGRYHAVTCIGAVIKGSTPHFDFVAGQAARLVAQAGYDTGIPVIFGVLTTDTIEQAIERAGTKMGNKGYESATSAIEMVNLYSQIGN